MNPFRTGAAAPLRPRMPAAPRRIGRPARWLVALPLVALPAMALAQGAPQGGTGPKPVGVVTMAPAAVPFTVTLPGRAVAYEQADIRPRVEGLVEAIPYAPGRPIKAGDPLFRLEADSYEATAAAAAAEVTRAEGSVGAARITLDRYRRLQGSGVTAEEVQTAEVALLQAEADLKSAQASLKTAQLNLDRTEIRSPIDGIPSVAAVSIGALVTANQTEALATVTRLDPIYVDVSEASARMLRVRDRIAQGSLQRGEHLEMALMLENGTIYDATGELVAPGVIVSPTTATLNLRLQFPNPDRLILPGQFLRVELTLGSSQAMLVPQRATSRSSTGDLTAYVLRDGKAVQVSLTASGSHDNAWIVTQGVEAGDQVIVDGLKTLRAGDAVTPVPVTIDGQGVVHDMAAGGTGATPAGGPAGGGGTPGAASAPDGRTPAAGAGGSAPGAPDAAPATGAAPAGGNAAGAAPGAGAPATGQGN